MTTPQAPRRRLPANPSLEHLRKQAKRLAKSSAVTLAAAQRQIAGEYGFKNWAALTVVVGKTERPEAPARSALVVAAARGDAALVDELLSGDAARSAAGEELNLALWTACGSDATAEQRLAVAGRLLAAGASPRWIGDAGSTAIHVAAKCGPRALVELLIRNGAFNWQRDMRGKTPLQYARKGAAPDKRDIAELLDRPVIRDATFRAAVKAIHGGDDAALRRLLDAHPSLLRDRAVEPDCYAQDYFRDPRLFWFVANNPTLMSSVPANITDLARTMIARGVEQADLDYALELAMSSGEKGWDGHQNELLSTLVDAGAKATPQAILVVLAHKCFRPVELLLDRGMAVTLPIAAALGRTSAVVRLLPEASAQERQDALGLAIITGEREAARLCLDAGADANAALPMHRHSMPLHQAALDDDVEMLRLLVAHGARLDARDTLWNGTPLGWAVHTGKSAAEAYLRSLG